MIDSTIFIYISSFKQDPYVYSVGVEAGINPGQATCHKQGTAGYHPTNVNNQFVFITLLLGSDWFYYCTSTIIIIKTAVQHTEELHVAADIVKHPRQREPAMFEPETHAAAPAQGPACMSHD